MKYLPLFVVIAVSGCRTFQEKPLCPQNTSEDFHGRTLCDPGVQGYLSENGAAGASWNVNTLALAAAYFHPDVALARAEAAEAAALIETAKMRPNPVLTFLPQFASFRAPPITPWFFGPSFSLPIETAGKRSKRTARALATAQAACWRVSTRSWAARSRVRGAMLELHSARENIRLLEIEQKLHREIIEKLNAQMNAGDVSPFELTQGRLMLNRNRLALQEAQRLAGMAEARLASAIGIPLHALKSTKLDFSSFASLAEPDSSQRKALTQRADLMALLSEYAAADNALRLELAKQYPDLNVMPGYDYNSGQNRWQLGLNLQIPLNQNRGPIAEAEARRVTVEKKFLAQQAAIQGELDIALASYQASRAKAKTAAQILGEATTASQTTQRMVEAGAVSPLELTRLQLEASAAAVALLTTEIEAQTAAGALEDAMQATLN